MNFCAKIAQSLLVLSGALCTTVAMTFKISCANNAGICLAHSINPTERNPVVLHIRSYVQNFRAVQGSGCILCHYGPILGPTSRVCRSVGIPRLKCKSNVAKDSISCSLQPTQILWCSSRHIITQALINAR